MRFQKGDQQIWKKMAVLFLSCALILSEAFMVTGVTPVQAKQKRRTSAGAKQQSQGVNTAYRSIEDIRKYVKENGATLNDPQDFERIPAPSAPYDPGKLSDQTQQSALKMLKQIRYIAGISDQVELDSNLCASAQAGAYLNYVNGKMDHNPEKPDDMDETLYNAGCAGAGSSNLAQAWNGRSLNETMIEGWMNDGDVFNIDRVGHRRWLLNPKMKKTGFGAAGAFSSVYVFDQSNSTASETGVAWPARNMPTEYFSDAFPWSISTGSRVDESRVHVTLTRLSDSKVWNFSKDSADGVFYVNNDLYGQTGCIIFRPRQQDLKAYEEGDAYQVEITGCGSTISYTVTFFDLIQLQGISAEYKGRPVIQGGKVDVSAITVTGTYSDGSTKKITDFTLEPYEIGPGNNSITVCYRDKKAVVTVPGAAEMITLKFDSTGGQAVSDQRIEKGSVLKPLPKTVRKGYIFEGWYTAKTGGEKLEETTALDKDMTFYARWKAVELSSIIAEYLGTRVIVQADNDLTTEDFQVIAVYTDGSRQQVHDFTIEAGVFQKGENTITIRYGGKSAAVKVNGVTVTNCIAFYYGGQKPAGTTKLEDREVSAKVQFSDGELFHIYYPECSVDPFVIQEGENTLTVRYGGKSDTFIVIGYSDAPEEQSVTIQFDSRGGSEAAAKTVNKGDAAGALPEPVKEGYQFMGWYTQAEGGIQITPETRVQTDITCYAHWTEKKPERPTAPDSPSGPEEPTAPSSPVIPEEPTKPSSPVTPEDPTVPSSPAAPEEPTTPSSPSVPQRPTVPQQPTGPSVPVDIPSDRVAVSFDAQGGAYTPPVYAERNGKLSYLPVTYRSGWIFQGWYTGRNGTGSRLTLDTVVSESRMYYAYWLSSDRTMTGIEISVSGTAYAGESVRGILNVKALYSNGTSQPVYDYTLSQSVLQAGNNWVTVTCYGYTRSIQIYAAAQKPSTDVESITAVYYGGGVPVGVYTVFDGLTVTAFYADGTVKEIKDYTLSGNTIKKGSNTVTVHYAGKTAQVEVDGYEYAAIQVHVAGMSDLWVSQGQDLRSVLDDYIPYKSGYQFAGWYLDEDCTQAVGQTASDGMNIYAKWQKIYNWKLNKKKAAVKQGKTVRLSVEGLKNSSIAWKTSNKKVASVSKKGLVKGKKAGVAVITAVTRDGSVLTCTVRVKKKAKKRG